MSSSSVDVEGRGHRRGGNLRARNIGWRIDHVAAHTSCVDPTGDHGPVVAELFEP